MNIEEINKKIQDEKDRHNSVINNLNDKKSDENKRYQRTMEYWRNQKEQLKKSQQNEVFDDFIKLTNKALEKYCKS